MLRTAGQLHGLRMESEHDFLRILARVADLRLPDGPREALPERLLAAVRKTGAFHAEGTPRAGDLVFFHGTRSGSGAGERRPTLAGIVERVDAGGTVRFLAQGPSTVDRSLLTPDRPGERRDQPSGRVLNSFLRVKADGDPPGTRYLAGQLLLGIGRLER